jgi:hypothetical protein
MLACAYTPLPYRLFLATKLLQMFKLKTKNYFRRYTKQDFYLEKFQIINTEAESNNTFMNYNGLIVSIHFQIFTHSNVSSGQLIPSFY